METIGICFLIWLLSIPIAAVVGSFRDRAGESVGFALVMGPLGIIIAALLPRAAESEARHQRNVQQAAVQLELRAQAARQSQQPRPSRRYERQRREYEARSAAQREAERAAADEPKPPKAVGARPQSLEKS